MTSTEAAVLLNLCALEQAANRRDEAERQLQAILEAKPC